MLEDLGKGGLLLELPCCRSGIECNCIERSEFKEFAGDCIEACERTECTEFVGDCLKTGMSQSGEFPNTDNKSSLPSSETGDRALCGYASGYTIAEFKEFNRSGEEVSTTPLSFAASWVCLFCMAGLCLWVLLSGVRSVSAISSDRHLQHTI
jgi:hypothetical protein